MWLFTNLAKALDTLPAEGRVLLLALLLTVALYGFYRLLAEAEGALRVLFGKGALAALVLVPGSVYLFDVQVPVPVMQMERFDTPWPAYVVWGLLGVWLVGAVVQLARVALEWRTQVRLVVGLPEANSKIAGRAAHWCQRLNLEQAVTVRCDGAAMPFQIAAVRGGVQIVLPAAALNWPVGVVDVLLLEQLALLKQSAWRWLLFGRILTALYWPATWVARMVATLAEDLVNPGSSLAQAAYRDPEGWQRDVRQLWKRADTLAVTERNNLLKLASHGIRIEPSKPPPAADENVDEVAEATFERRWAGTKRRHAAKVRDPYERAYWLIAVASIVVGVASTLTLKQAAPEFEPRFLNIKWQDQMVRRIDAYESTERNREPPRVLDAASSDPQPD